MNCIAVGYIPREITAEVKNIDNLLNIGINKFLNFSSERSNNIPINSIHMSPVTFSDPGCHQAFKSLPAC